MNCLLKGLILKVPYRFYVCVVQHVCSVTGVTWRIIPVSKWLVTPIYKPFRPFIRGTTLLGELIY